MIDEWYNFSSNKFINQLKVNKGLEKEIYSKVGGTIDGQSP